MPDTLLTINTLQDTHSVGSDAKLLYDEYLRSKREFEHRSYFVGNYVSSFTEKKFTRLKELWKNETKLLSDSSRIYSNNNYLEIIKLGSEVLPFLLKDLQDTNNNWFEALYQITGIDPVLEEHWGDIEAMKNDWLKWAKEFEVI